MKKRSLIFASLVSLIIIIPSALTSQTVSGWQASKETVETLSKKQPNVNYYEEKVPAFNLPDLLTTLDGKKITLSKDWLKYRRPELLELFKENVYGRIPETSYKMNFKVINEDLKAIGGAASLRQVDINIDASGKSLVIHLSLFVPNNTSKPVPVFLLICNRGKENIDPTRKVKSEFWPVEEAIARGYGIAAFFNGDVDPDKFDNFKNGIHGMLDKDIRPPDAWGTICAWAWGASRCMDYLVTDKRIDKKKVAVIGHSRGGKTALWAGAIDERFAMVVSNESGCGGAALSRRKYGETVALINKAMPHWFCTNFKKYDNNEDALPVDQHMLLALTAPRALYVACTSEDLWGDPRGSYLALYNSLPVFRLFNKNTSIPQSVPQLNEQIISGNVAFHIRNGEHNLTLKDWNFFMDFGDVVLK